MFDWIDANLPLACAMAVMIVAVFGCTAYANTATRRYRWPYHLAVLASLVAFPMWAADVTIDGPTTVPPYKIVRLKAKDVSEKAGVIWKVRPLVGNAQPDWASRQTNRTVEWVAPPGQYRVELTVVTVSADGTPGLDYVELVVTIGDPAPVPPGPGPGPGPAPADPLLAAVRAAYKAAPDAEAAVWLASVYRTAAESTANDPTLVTLQQLSDVMSKAGSTKAPLPRLSAARQLVQKELTAQLGTDGAAPLMPELRTKAAAQFRRMASIWEEVARGQ